MCHDKAPFYLSNALKRSLILIRQIVALVPVRVIDLSHGRPCVILASDAHASAGSHGGAALFYDRMSGAKFGFYVDFTAETLVGLGFSCDEAAGAVGTIAVCEAATLALALFWFLRYCPKRRVVCFIDNTVSLHSFVKGGSSQARIDRACALAHLCAFFTGCELWFEFIKSEANWADSASRLGKDDPFARELGFEVKDVKFRDALFNCGDDELVPLLQKALEKKNARCMLKCTNQ